MKILSDVMIHTNAFMFRLTLYSSQAQVLGFNLTIPMDPSSLTEAAAFHRRAVSRTCELNLMMDSNKFVKLLHKKRKQTKRVIITTYF